jgi:hypothetical protein
MSDGPELVTMAELRSAADNIYTRQWLARCHHPMWRTSLRPIRDIQATHESKALMNQCTYVQHTLDRKLQAQPLKHLGSSSSQIKLSCVLPAIYWIQYGDSLLKWMFFHRQICLTELLWAQVSKVKIELPDDNSEWEW